MAYARAGWGGGGEVLIALNYILSILSILVHWREIVERYFLPLITVLSKLKCFWFILLFIGLILTYWGLENPDSLVWNFMPYIGGAIIGFASSAFFSRPNQFLIRGSGDPVYLIQNHAWLPHIYQLNGRKTLNAFGGIWHETSHVSEAVINDVSLLLYKKGRLNIEDAELYRVEGGKTVFAVLLDTRYGVPDAETQKHIWGDKEVKEVRLAKLDEWKPGRDLVSKNYWPAKDRL